jgi:predicted alternative tryptophan synthase beta-subunit
MEPTRILLEAHEIPTHWYNIAADLPAPLAPPLLPDGSPAGAEQLSEAVEEAAGRHDTNYALGSVLNHVVVHQSIIGLEAKKQFDKIGLYPDVVIAPCGGGSSFGGIAFPFLGDKAASDRRAVAVEPASCPSLTKGRDTPRGGWLRDGALSRISIPD